MKWQSMNNDGATVAVKVDAWILYVSPLPDGTFEGVILGYNNKVGVVIGKTSEDARGMVADLFIAILSGWKIKAEQLREATK